MTTEEPAIATNDPLHAADQMITTAWGQPISTLEATAIHHPDKDPLLRSVLHIRQTLASAYRTVYTHQEHLHTLTGSDVITSRYDLDRITASATALRVASTEAETATRAIEHLIHSRELADQARRTRAERRQAAATRTQGADSPAVPPSAPARTPHR
ncbi:hypothetical protein [Streptomyces acidiscabies]|uniref:Uncharacterized protein n=1 Tax=Streptomyces acidiscabies TaxID=42234 RepID=A0AAP6BLM6_9ACTN|nr:hypothetical protein [Streptomyces acidiscabies]MBP5936724.1 hypothetical protein [Streptomyces sp. LBUM 1476]MBZ3915272.1 hypothetical protein [Streptomyces acidiscabies]MDX2967032.1 hypothetical protein [Streptomyces acidiscabies]MDX3021333.1 hypothetical protein [Streptomyces acidiscabies]MDX3793414.1 hypothetical protein [Streptomyces acidiscabies]